MISAVVQHKPDLINKKSTSGQVVVVNHSKKGKQIL